MQKGGTIGLIAMDKAPAAAVRAAFIAFVAPGNHVLFLKRPDNEHGPGEWSLPGGKIEDGETAEEAALREAEEEIGFDDWVQETTGSIKQVAAGENRGVQFTTFRQPVAEPFEPKLNDEHVEYLWAPTTAAPEPLHPGLLPLLTKIAMDGRTVDAIALDRAPENRRKDQDGRLHVVVNNISKAAVNPYLGKEIPGWKDLGLQPNQFYKLLRDPDELAKSAPTFDNLPILDKHQPVDVENHAPELVIGSLGTDNAFESPFLRNSLVLWAKDAVDDVEAERRKELSAGYRYKADMTPGVWAQTGERYDGVMRDIVGNHVALVKEGRAGPDVVVGDSKPTLEMTIMAPALSRKAVFIAGGLAARVLPILAQDAKFDVNKILDGVTTKNFAEKKPAVLIALRAELKGKLAQDESIDEVIKLLDHLDGVKVAEGVDEDPATGLPMTELPEAVDDDPMAKVKEFLATILSPEQLAQVEALTAAKTAPPEAAPKVDAIDEPPPFKGMPEVGGKVGKIGKDRKLAGDKDPDDKDKEKDMVSKPAMDQAIGVAVKKAQEDTIKAQRAIRDAEKAVKPHVGELAIACDSADAVYEQALKMLGVDVTDVHPSAYPAILKQIPLPGAGPRPKEIAMDAASVSGFEKRFPNGGRIAIAG